MKKKIFKVYSLFFKKKKKQQLYKIGNKKFHNSLVDSLVPEFVEIGDNFISAPGSIILAHDASPFNHNGTYRVEKTIIGNDVFLGANSVIMPGVKIGKGAIIGAGAVVTKDIKPYTIAVGVPAREISTVDNYINKCKQRRVLVEAPVSFNKIKENKHLTYKDIEDLRVRSRQLFK